MIQQPMNTPRILVVEDDDLQYEIYEDVLGAYELVRATTGRDALRCIRQKAPNLIILDHILDDGELGLDYLPELKELLPYVPIIVVSGVLQVHQQFDALQ